MLKVRILFQKNGRSKWISHLDLMQTMHRSFLRAGIPLMYSEGFNPHPQMSIALPLGVGVSSECEIMDIRCGELFTPSEVNPFLPEGIQVLEVYEPERKVSDIAWLKVCGIPAHRFPESAAELFSRDQLVMEKKSKRGVAPVDIRPMIAKIDISPDQLTAVIAAQNPTLNPFALRECILQLSPESDSGYISFTRLEIYDEQGRVFR